MRPGDFSPGNWLSFAECSMSVDCFNEAGGFLPRKPVPAADMHTENMASMRPGDFSPGNKGREERVPDIRAALQ